MNPFPAIAVIEFRDVPSGIYSTDTMVKKAPIAVLACGIISGGRYLTIIGGSTASVDESFREGLFHGGAHVLDSAFLPDAHPQLAESLQGRRRAGAGALAILETDTVSSNIRAVEIALKGTGVDLLEIRIADSSLSGKGISLFRGALHDIEAAMDLAGSFLRQSLREARIRILPAPHDLFAGHIETSSFFLESGMSDLDGEEV